MLYIKLIIEQESRKVDFNWAATHSHSFPVRNDISHAEQEKETFAVTF